MGTRFKPLRIKYNENDRKRFLYVITDFSRFTRVTKNDKWYEMISELMKE